MFPTMSGEQAERLWRALPKATGALALLGTLIGALVHGEFKVWDVAYYLGFAVFLLPMAMIPGGILGVVIDHFSSESDLDITLMLCVGLFAAIFTALLAANNGPQDTDTFGRVALSAVGIGGLVFAFYKAEAVKPSG